MKLLAQLRNFAAECVDHGENQLAEELNALVRRHELGLDKGVRKVYVEIPGDSSVGIQDYTIVIPMLETVIDADPEGVRHTLIEAFKSIIGDPLLYVTYEGECPDCGMDGYTTGNCQRHDCISHQPDPVA